MSKANAAPSARDLMAASASLQDQLASLPEAELLEEMAQTVKAMRAGPVRVVTMLTEAMPDPHLNQYVASLLNLVATLAAQIEIRQREMATRAADQPEGDA